MMTVILFFITLSILVFVHEWGHFIVAKKAGIRVDVFSIGYGGRLFGFKWHGTDYRFSPLPFGGYVKIYGQEPLEEAEGDAVLADKIARDPQSFASKSILARLAVVLGGPVMNLVLCLVVLPLVFMVGRMQPRVLAEPPTVIDVVADSPAAKLGLQKGDTIVSLAGKATPTWQKLMLQVSLHPQSTVDIEYLRAGALQRNQVNITTHKQMRTTIGFLGIEPTEFVGNEPLIDAVKAGSPAEKAGVLHNDRVLSLNGTEVKTWTTMTELIQASEGKPLTAIVDRGGQTVTLSFLPEYDEGAKTWLMGMTKAINPMEFKLIRYGFVDSLRLGVLEFKNLFDMTLDILKRLFTFQLSWKVLGGPLQIAQATSQAASAGFGDFLYMLAFLSLQLGVMNLLPVPVLDGGHVVFLAIETIFRRPLPHKVRMVSIQVGVLMLFSLMLIVTINDVNMMFNVSHWFEKLRGAL